jgi:chromosome partitioning protein
MHIAPSLRGTYMQIICVTNQKGGCGKTVTTLNLGAALARKGSSVLIVDLDPQAPIAPGLGAMSSDHNGYELLPIANAIKERKLDSIIIATSTERLFVAPGDNSLDAQALQRKPHSTLRRALKALTQPFDFILLDTPPNLDLVTLNGIMAADWLILPCDVDKESLMSLKRTLEVVFEYVEDRDDVEEVESFYRALVTIYDQREKVMNRWFDKQMGTQDTIMFNTRIHRASAFKKARTGGMSIFDYVGHGRTDEERRAIEDFEKLSEEVSAHAKRRIEHRHPVANTAPETPVGFRES